MKRKLNKEGLKLLLIICDNDKGDILQKFFADNYLDNGIVFMSKGTSTSNIADLFGFGINDRIFIGVLVPDSSAVDILDHITDALGIERDSYGLTMLLDVNSCTSAVMDMLGLDY